MLKKLSFYQPDLKESWLLFLITVLLGSIFSFAVYFPLLKIFPSSEYIEKDLSYFLMFIPTLFFIMWRTNRIISRKDPFTQPKSVNINNPNFGQLHPILFFVILIVTGFSFQIFFDPLSNLLTPPDWFIEALNKMVGGKFFPSFIAVSILAPLLEEYLCRGIITRGLLEHTTPAKAIFWSSLIFAILHLNPWQGVVAFLLGIFYGWIYYRTRSIWATIFLHFINNTISLSIPYLFPELQSALSFRDVITDAPTYWLIISISVGLLSVSIFLLNKFLPKRDVKE